MYRISIISSSIRTGRKSHNVALYFEKYLSDNYPVIVEVLDLKEFDFPLFKAPFKYQKSPSESIVQFRDKIIASDGVLVVTPEYNGSFPASLKNVIDLLYEEWHRKPIAFSTVSSGDAGWISTI